MRLYPVERRAALTVCDTHSKKLAGTVMKTVPSFIFYEGKTEDYRRAPPLMPLAAM